MFGNQLEQYYFSGEDAEFLDSNIKGAQGFGDLVKALEAQEGVTDYATLTGGGALQPQSLEDTHALLTWTDKQLKFQKDIGISKAYSTVEEYTLQDAYGQEGPWVDQLDNPEEADPDFFRDITKIKFLRGLWKVSDVLGYSRTITDPYAVNVEAAAYRVMRGLERGLFFGDDTVLPQEIVGAEKVINDFAPANIFDLRGQPLTQEVIRQAAELIADNYGMASKMYVSNSTMSSIEDILGKPDSQRIVQNQGNLTIDLGDIVNGFRSSFGRFTFEPDVFLDWETQTVPKVKNPANPRTQTEGATSAKAPDTPTISGLAATADADTQHVALSTGVRFRVAAFNKYGYSAATAASAQVGLAAAQSYDLEITPAGSGEAATGFAIYRETGEGTGVYNLIKRIANAGSPTNYLDANADLPGTAKAFMVDLSSVGSQRAISMAQLAPMHKLEYARIAPFRWGTVNWYLGMKWYAPQKMVLFKNVGVGKAQGSPLIDL